MIFKKVTNCSNYAQLSESQEENTRKTKTKFVQIIYDYRYGTKHIDFPVDVGELMRHKRQKTSEQHKRWSLNLSDKNLDRLTTFGGRPIVMRIVKGHGQPYAWARAPNPQGEKI